MKLPENVEKIKDEILEVSDFIFNHPELSSEEVQSSAFLTDKISGFTDKVEKKYLGMDTAFKAEVGSGNASLSVFSEFDALPLGHACGHNLIAAWGYGVFRAASLDENPDYSLTLFGSPAEEGRGKFASSKIKISGQMQKLGIDAAFVVHPHTSWEVSGHYFARWRSSYTFLGKPSHAAGSPEKGINALDAAVIFYMNNKMIKSTLDQNMHTVLSEIIKEGGSAVNIIPDKAEVWVDLRCAEDTYAKEVVSKIERASKSAAESNGSKVEFKELAPFTSSFKQNKALDSVFHSSASKYIDGLISLEESAKSKPMGSSDVGNVSQVVPTSQLLIKIAEEGMSLHTKEFRDAAGSKASQVALLKAVAAGYDAVRQFAQQKK